MLLAENTVASVLKSDVVISLLNTLYMLTLSFRSPNILFDMMNEILLIVNGNHIEVIKSLLNGAHFTLPSIIVNSHFKN